MNLKSIMLDERSQTQRAMYYMISFVWNSWNRQIHKDRKWLPGVEEKGMVMGMTLLFRWWKYSGISYWYWLHNLVSVLKTTRSYTSKGVYGELYLRKSKRKCHKQWTVRRFLVPEDTSFNGLSKAQSSFHLMRRFSPRECISAVVFSFTHSTNSHWTLYVQESRQYMLPLTCCFLKASIIILRELVLSGNCSRGPL